MVKTSVLKRALQREGFKFGKRLDDEQPSFFIRKDGLPVASAVLTLKADGSYKVITIDVDESFRRKKLGTAIYEEMLAFACSKGAPVRSDELRSHYAEAFWRKQAQKGRATCRKPLEPAQYPAGMVFTEPLYKVRRGIADKCRTKHPYSQKDADACTEKGMEKVMSTLPEPKMREGYGAYWECDDYELSLKSCGSSLDGLRKKRKKRASKSRSRR